MEALQVILLGILQGIAEFLPISSSGHLVFAEELLGERLESPALNIALHLGTLGSILVVYHDRIRRLLSQQRILLMIVLATLPLVVVGLPLKFLFDYLNAKSLTPLVAAVGLLVTAAYMFRSQRIVGGQALLEDISPRIAISIGVLQAVAATPGISRSGSTIFAALVLGLSRPAAADFSFLIAIPAILGATVLYSKDIYESGATGLSSGLLALGAVVSFVVGVLALRWLLKVVVKGSLDWFAWYCLAMGSVCIVWQSIHLWG
jgi:undecaprenyl-diphosphatase